MRGAIEAALRQCFEGEPAGIIAAYLFGSVARGEARAGSDVDVAILYREAPPATLDGLPVDLEHRLPDLLAFVAVVRRRVP